VYDCRFNLLASLAQFAWPMASVDTNESTQCRQFIVADTGSGGTEVKNLKWKEKVKQFGEMSTSMLKIGLQWLKSHKMALR